MSFTGKYVVVFSFNLLTGTRFFIFYHCRGPGDRPPRDRAGLDDLCLSRSGIADDCDYGFVRRPAACGALGSGGHYLLGVARAVVHHDRSQRCRLAGQNQISASGFDVLGGAGNSAF